MLCIHCGYEIPEGESVCPSCGKSQEEELAPVEKEPFGAAALRALGTIPVFFSNWLTGLQLNTVQLICMVLAALAALNWLLSINASGSVYVLFLFAAGFAAFLCSRKTPCKSVPACLAWTLMGISELVHFILLAATGGLTFGYSLVTIAMVASVICYWLQVQQVWKNAKKGDICMVCFFAFFALLEVFGTLHRFKTFFLLANHLGYLFFRLCFAIWAISEERALMNEGIDEVRSGRLLDRMEDTTYALYDRYQEYRERKARRNIYPSLEALDEAPTEWEETSQKTVADPSELNEAIQALEDLELLPPVEPAAAEPAAPAEPQKSSVEDIPTEPEEVQEDTWQASNFEDEVAERIDLPPDSGKKLCPHCGTPLHELEKLCPHCGAEIY